MRRSSVRIREVAPKLRPKMSNTDNLKQHEVLDRSMLVLELFSDYVADHPIVENDPTLKKLADEISEKLYNFYSTIGDRYT